MKANDIINILDDDMNQCSECDKWINYNNTVVLRHSQEYFCLDCYYKFMGYGKEIRKKIIDGSRIV